MSDFEPVPYHEWAEANPDLAALTKKCKTCDGAGRFPEVDCECPDCGDKHTASERDCWQCNGSGEVKMGETLYGEQVAADRKRWQRWTAASLHEEVSDGE